MNIKKILGAAGAVVTGLGALILAGKSGFGENLGRSNDEFKPEDFDDDDAPAAPEEADATDTTEDKTE